MSISRIPVTNDGKQKYYPNESFAMDKDENLVAMFSLKNQSTLIIYEANGLYKLDTVKLSSDNLLLQ